MKEQINLVLQFVFLICSTVLCTICQSKFVLILFITFSFYLITNYFLNDIHITKTYLVVLVLISIVYTLGMFVHTPLMMYGLILKGSCPILINFLNKKQLSNSVYKRIKNSETLSKMPLNEALFEIELEIFDGLFIDVSEP